MSEIQQHRRLHLIKVRLRNSTGIRLLVEPEPRAKKILVYLGRGSVAPKRRGQPGPRGTGDSADCLLTAISGRHVFHAFPFTESAEERASYRAVGCGVHHCVSALLPRRYRARCSEMERTPHYFLRYRGIVQHFHQTTALLIDGFTTNPFDAFLRPRGRQHRGRRDTHQPILDLLFRESLEIGGRLRCHGTGTSPSSSSSGYHGRLEQ